MCSSAVVLDDPVTLTGCPLVSDIVSRDPVRMFDNKPPVVDELTNGSHHCGDVLERQFTPLPLRAVNSTLKRTARRYRPANGCVSRRRHCSVYRPCCGIAKRRIERFVLADRHANDLCSWVRPHSRTVPEQNEFSHTPLRLRRVLAAFSNIYRRGICQTKLKDFRFMHCRRLFFVSSSLWGCARIVLRLLLGSVPADASFALR